MEVYTTEEEQLQAVINWFKKNGMGLLISILTVSAVTFSWKYWNNYTADNLVKASMAYEEFQSAKKDADRAKLAQDIVKNYKSTIYGKTAAIYLAGQKVAEKKWQEAANEYEDLYAQTKSFPELQMVIFENLVRSEIELKKIDSAYARIEKAEKNTDFVKLYPMNFYNLKGDLLAKKNKNAEAIAAYNMALDSVNNDPLLAKQMSQVSNWITLKRNDLLAAKPLA